MEYRAGEPSCYAEGQKLVCIESNSYKPTAPFSVERGKIYTVEHACQYGPAVVLVGLDKCCWWDIWFLPVEEMSEEQFAELTQSLELQIT